MAQVAAYLVGRNGGILLFILGLPLEFQVGAVSSDVEKLTKAGKQASRTRGLRLRGSCRAGNGMDVYRGGRMEGAFQGEQGGSGPDANLSLPSLVPVPTDSGHRCPNSGRS